MPLKFIKTKFNSFLNKGKSKPILIFISSYTDTPVLSMLANQLIEKQENVLFIMRNHDEQLLAKIKLFIPNFTNKYLVIEHEAKEISPINENEIPFERIAKKYEDFDLCLNTLKALYILQYTELFIAQQLILKIQPKILIVPEDGISANSCLIHAAIQSKIPVLNVPYGYGSHYDLENALHQKQIKGELYTAEEGAGKAVKKYYPHWVKSGKFAGAILLNPHFILAMEELKLAIQNPWTVHGGAATKIAVESQIMLKHYINEGIPSQKLSLTGTPYCDYLKTRIDVDKRYQEVFLRSEKIAKDKTSILICWPPSYHAERAEQCQYATYEELTITVISYLAKLKNVTVTLTIHPAVQPEFVKLLKEFNVKISTDYILSELIKHDIYVSCFSSTIRWAIAAAKPVINYDFYQFNLLDYQEAPGVLNAKSFAEFQQLANKLTADEDYYQKIALLQKRHAEDWGILDGLNFERIYSLIKQLSHT
ncbi:hypothetical protein [Legionella cardiaca]|uniref:Uncharacterized protein n=1 Tax=Legionella cardiaca TaxID=1071983 RepID=A0ABY8AMV8_9GAMM|nr:hypothetical protein [Legionella cardiaca]WED41903.1 hypothetical protein PXX05_08135 [Legionella cardiaca]